MNTTNHHLNQDGSYLGQDLKPSTPCVQSMKCHIPDQEVWFELTI